VVAVLENPSTRLTSQFIAILSPLLTAKDKSVRYRSTQLISHIVNSLDCLDDEVYRLIRTGLLGRIKDKESMIRTQAVLGLCRLAGDEGGEDADDDSQDSDDSCNLLERLLWVLQNDPSAEVRRALLLNLPLTPTTLPFLLERARDLDPATRRALFSRLLPALGDFRHLSLSMREKLLRWGLRDRDETVRKATAKLFRERWIGDCVGALTSMVPNQPNDMGPPSSEALLELLERIDVVNSGVENGIALDAMMEFWRGRPDCRDAINFDDAFWESLSAESVFLARSLNDFCREESNGKHESLADQKIPEVTQMALHIRRCSDNLIQHLRQLGGIEGIDGEEDTVEQEFIVEQLLHIAQTLDYSDEVGRRKMFALLREILAVAELPEEITKLVVQTIRIVCGNHTEAEREFCGVILEAIAEVHDTIAPEEIAADEEDESFHSARSVLNDAKSKTIAGSKNLSLEELERDENQTIKEITVNLKCLFIAQSMLQNVELTLDGNVHLVTMLNNLIVPAVRSHEAPIRERGLLCLGLCCLLDKVRQQSWSRALYIDFNTYLASRGGESDSFHSLLLKRP
jgi:condensin complex subunit 3